MKIIILTKPSAREEGVEKVSDGEFKVSVKEPAKEGRANWAIERVLAKHFGVPVSCVRIISGHASRKKIVEII